MKIKLERDVIQELRQKAHAWSNPFACVKGCSKCCGPVPFTRWERKMVMSCLSPRRDESFWFDEGFSKTREDGLCVFSGPSGCQIYKQRPMLCRLFGHVEKMKCPFVPEVCLMPQDIEWEILGRYFPLFPSNIMESEGWRKLALQEKRSGLRHEIMTDPQNLPGELTGYTMVPDMLRTERMK
jgi:Fe-S-cluster containining protein